MENINTFDNYIMEKQIQNKKVLITGGAGFIGSNLCEALLEQGNQVTCLDNFLTGKRENISAFLNNDLFSLIEGDIRDLSTCMNATKGIDIILHQAALGSIPRSINDPHTTNNINVGGFLNMLDAAKTNEVKRFVYASSSSVYGTDNHIPKQEEFTGTPLSPYAVSKKTNELYASVYASLHNMEIIGLRYFNVFGKRQDPNGVYAAAIPKFIELLLKGESPVIYGDGEQSRDFTYISNVIQANQLAALCDYSTLQDKIFNVACGQKISVNELIRIIKEIIAPYFPDVVHVFPKHEIPRKGDIPLSIASLKNIQEKLQFVPVCDVHKGLELTVNWFFKEHNNK